LWHWAFRLKDCKNICALRDMGRENEVGAIYLKPLYL